MIIRLVYRGGRMSCPMWENVPAMLNYYGSLTEA